MDMVEYLGCVWEARGPELRGGFDPPALAFVSVGDDGVGAIMHQLVDPASMAVLELTVA